MSVKNPYTPLWCKSYYSFLEGASSPEQYVSEAAKLGLKSFAITDRDGIYGVVKAYEAALEHDIHLIIGSEITVKDPDLPKFSILFLVQNQQGYSNLCRLITLGRRRCEKGSSEVTFKECCMHAEGLYGIWLPQGISTLEEQKADHVFGAMKSVFNDRLLIMICRHSQHQEPLIEFRSKNYAKQYGIRTVAGIEVLYHQKTQQPIQDVLTCIRHNQTLSESKNLLKPNALHSLIEPDEFERLFADDPASVEATIEIAEKCQFRLDEIRYAYPDEVDSIEITVNQQLRELTRKGALYRYSGEPPQNVTRQLERELQLIEDLNYGSYFLTMHRIVRWCRQSNIMCQGRGSAANSAVCFCLGITQIDPVDMNLLFERFLSRERNEPPDIDLDIEHERREEVIQHVYDTYGRDHAGMVAVVIRYRIRSAIRDVGAALGIPINELLRISKIIDSYGLLGAEDLTKASLDPEIRTYRLLILLANAILDFPRHLSIHPGGFVFTTGRIDELIPVENATMPNRTVIQWEKDDLKTMKIFKVDLLGLGALTQIHQCFDLLSQHRNLDLCMHSIPKDDEQVFEMLQKADTTGVFQIESRAQMSMLPRLKPKQWYDLVVQIAIVRPGPISGNMVHPYLRRRSGEEPTVYPHPSLEPVLGKTLGIPIFQEQVIKLAMVVADYQPGEADQLRRDMAAWRRVDRLEQHREKLISRMIKKGIEESFAEQVFNQIRGFGEYGFPESHSASFALIAYTASYLKCHYPTEFACSLLNSQPMGFYSPATIIEDARRHGVRILPVDIRFSERNCTVELCHESKSGYALRIGYRYISGLNHKDIEALQRARCDVQSIEELAQETRISKAGIQKLAEAGALRGLAANRRTALWIAHGVSQQKDILLPLRSCAKFEELDARETTAWDYRNTGVSTHGHILAHYRDQLLAQKLPDAKTVNSLEDGSRVRYVGAVICRQRPASASKVVFMTLEDETGYVNAVFWPRCFERYSVLAKTLSLLGVEGNLQVAENVVHLIVDYVWKPDDNLIWKDFKSRNFH